VFGVTREAVIESALRLKEAEKRCVIMGSKDKFEVPGGYSVLYLNDAGGEAGFV
jgi:hypothetical protein